MMKRLVFDKKKLLTRGKNKTYYIRPSIFGKQRTVSFEVSDERLATRRFKRFVTLFNKLCDERETGLSELSSEDIYGTAVVDLRGKPAPEPKEARLLIEDLIGHYKDYNEHASNPRPVKQQSLDSYVYRIRAIAKAAEVEFFDELTGMSLVEIARKINPVSSNNTIRNQFSALSSLTKREFVKYLGRFEIVIENPFKGERQPEHEVHAYQPFGLDKQQEIWEECVYLPKAQAMIIRMALGIGLRRGEIEHATPAWFTALQVMDGERKITEYKCTVQPVNMPNGKRWTPKSNKSREIPIPKELYEILTEWRQSAEGYSEGDLWMIPSTQGGVPDSRLYADMVSVLKWLAEKGLKTEADNKLIHKLRKQFGSAVLRKTKSLEAVSAYLGHASITTTEKHYIGLIDKPVAEIF